MYIWVGQHSRENNILPPKASRLFSAIFPPLGIPYYLLKGFGFKGGTLRITFAIGYLAVLLGGYEILYRTIRPLNENSVRQNILECSEINNNVIRTACYDKVSNKMGLETPSLPSHYSDQYLNPLPKEARANCKQLSQLMFGIELEGTRSYLDTLPEGLRVENQRPQGFWGIDSISGSTHGMPLRNLAVSWYEGRVARLIATFQVEFEYELELYLETIEGLTNTAFEYDESSELRYLLCEPGVRITASTSETGGFGTRRPNYVLLINFISELNDLLDADILRRRQI